jgi:hypothetical protein
MTFLATSTFSILRGSYQSPTGDQVDSDDAVQHGIPGSVREVRSDETTISDGMPRQIRYLVGRFAADVDVRHEDRILDENTGAVYLVDGISEPGFAFFNVDKVLELRRAS